MIRHKFYQLMKSSPWNYIINITHIYMNKSIHINDSIPVTITHVQENRKSVKKKRKKKFCVDTMIMLDIFVTLYNEESFRSSNKLVNFFKIETVIFIS
jgi:cellulose synthase/poly-beta-1,6-N-acetylglucosamine synthase-like glycosyltransferase